MDYDHYMQVMKVVQIANYFSYLTLQKGIEDTGSIHLIKHGKKQEGF